MPRQLVDGKTKKQWVLEQPPDISPMELAELGRAAGFADLNNAQVSNIRGLAGLKPSRPHPRGATAKRGRPRGRPKARAKRAEPAPRAPRERRQDGSEDERALRSLIMRLGTLRVLAVVDEFNSLAGR